MHSVADRSVARRYVGAAGVGALFAVVLFVVVLQSGRGTALDRDLLGDFYDAQARALMAGQVDVDPMVPGFEGFQIGDEVHIYQGIAPALARIPLLALTDRFDGRLTGLSMTLAFVVAMVYVVAAGWRIRSVIRGPAHMGRTEAACTAVATFGIGCGPLLFLASNAWVYHEALVWGTALCLGSLTHLAYWMSGRPAAGRAQMLQLGAAVVLAALAINTRSSVGAGPLVALGLTALCLVVAQRGRSRGSSSGGARHVVLRLAGWNPDRTSEHPMRSIVVIVVGVLAATVLYTAVNYARFDSLVGVPLDRQALVATDVARQEALAANDNSLFGLQYAPTVLAQALRPDAVAFRSQFPYVGFPTERPSVIGDAVFAELDWSSSLPVAAPLLFLGTVVGLVVLVAPNRVLGAAGRTGAGDVVWFRIPVVGAALSGAVIVVFGYVAQRYLADLYPLAVLAGLIGLQSIAARLDTAPGSTRSRRSVVAAVATGVVVASLWGAWVTTGTALQYSHEIAPGSTAQERAGWLSFQRHWPGSPDIIEVEPSTELPAPGPVGQLAVVGDCDALYRSSGAIWYLLESGPAGGGVTLTMTRTGDLGSGATVVHSAGGAGSGSARLLLEPAGDASTGDEAVRLVVEVEQDGEVARSLPGRPFTLADGDARHVAISMDWRNGHVEVVGIDPDEELLAVAVDLPAAGVEAIRDGPIAISDIDDRTALCDRLHA